MTFFFKIRKANLIKIIITAAIAITILTFMSCSGGGGGARGGAGITGGAADGTPEITVDYAAGLTTTESGGEATFQIVLNSQPTDNVTIDLICSNILEGTISPATLTFTSSNWNAPQIVTITGVDDAIQDGEQAYSIITQPAVSDDSDYDAMDGDDVPVTNTDNDTAGITVGAISGDTTEAGGQATFTIVLNSEPTDDVVIDLSSGDTLEGTVSPASLTFTPLNWDAPQTVTATGVDDVVIDCDLSYDIITDPAASSDINYDGINPANVTVVNIDNDSAGVTVGAISGDTTEAGGRQHLQWY
jgi:hypothetical protein